MKRHRFGLVAALATASIAWAVVPATSLAATSKHLASHDGGTLKLTYQGAPGSMDPQINYTLQGWQIEQATQDGLVNFKKAQGTAAYTVVPDLAVAIPEADRRRQDVGVQDAQGHQVLQRPGRQAD